jgi:hypothetical protein
MADDRLAAAISHWAPRFIAGGVHPGDFDCITVAMDSWDDWCAGWSQAAAGHEELGTRALPGPAELLLLEQGNHGCANLPYLHRPYSADWMARQLAR